LFVDDEATMVEIARITLERLGYDVLTTTDPRAALALVTNAPQAFDVVLTDQVMPDLHGSDLARALRHTRPDLPIVILTGDSTAYSEEEARLEGFRFLSKPFSKEQLRTVLEGALIGREGP
jgi:CheY-like chemotaxis protein